MSERRIHMVIASALNIKKGDKVLINAGEGLEDRDAWQDVLVKLRERFPGVEFTMLGGANQIAVLPGGEDQDEVDLDALDPGLDMPGRR